MLRKLGIAILRATLWSALVGALITLALVLRTSPELRPSFPVASWLGLCWALAFVPTVAMELGVAHLLPELGHAHRGDGRSGRPSREG